MTKLDETTISRYYKKGAVFAIPEEITEIGDRVFYGNPFLEKIIITGNILRIGNEVFRGCVHLNEVEFKHNNIKEPDYYGHFIFSDCPELKKVCFEDWEAYWKYKYDSLGGPLCNDAKLYIGEELVDTIIIPKDIKGFTCGIMQLSGVTGIKNILFEDGEKPVECIYQNNHCLTRQDIFNKLLQRHPMISKLIETNSDLDKILSKANSIHQIWSDIDDLTVWFFRNANYDIMSMGEGLGTELYKRLEKKKAKDPTYYIEPEWYYHIYSKPIFEKWIKVYKEFYSLEKEKERVQELLDFYGLHINTDNWDRSVDAWRNVVIKYMASKQKKSEK